jgi:hypothetical protein
MNQYIFAVTLTNGAILELSAIAEWERDARAIVWRTMTDEQCNACESIECVDVIPA